MHKREVKVIRKRRDGKKNSLRPPSSRNRAEKKGDSINRSGGKRDPQAKDVCLKLPQLLDGGIEGD